MKLSKQDISDLWSIISELENRIKAYESCEVIHFKDIGDLYYSLARGRSVFATCMTILSKDQKYN